VFAVVHIHPVVALALCVCVHTKLILEAKLNLVVGRGLEHKISFILFSLVSSLIPLNKLHGGKTYTFHCFFWEVILVRLIQ